MGDTANKVEVLPAGSVPTDVPTRELMANNITEDKLIQLETDYAELAVTPIETAEQLEVAQAAAKDLQKTRTTTEKICKAGREESNRISKMWVDKQNAIIDRIAKVEDPLDDQIKAYKNREADKLKAEELKAKEPMRLNILTSVGVTPETEEWKTMSDEQFLAYVNTQTEAIAAKKKEEEERERIAADAVRKERINIRHQRMLSLRFKLTPETETYWFSFKTFQKEVNHLKENIMNLLDHDFDTLVSLHTAAMEEDDKQWAEVQAQQQKKIDEMNRRTGEMAQLGFIYSGTGKCFVFQLLPYGTIRVVEEQVYECGEEEFAGLLAGWGVQVAELRKQSDDAKAEGIRKQAEIDLQKKQDDEKVAAAAAQKKIDDEAEEERKKRLKEAALLPEKQKLLDYVNALVPPQKPIVNTPEGLAITRRVDELYRLMRENLTVSINKL